MTKTELVEQVSQKTGLSKKDSGKAVDAILGSISDSLKTGSPVQLVGFGTFEVRERAARTGRNPQTGAEIKIKARKVPVFRPGKALKESVR